MLRHKDLQSYTLQILLEVLSIDFMAKTNYALQILLKFHWLNTQEELCSNWDYQIFPNYLYSLFIKRQQSVFSKTIVYLILHKMPSNPTCKMLIVIVLERKSKLQYFASFYHFYYSERWDVALCDLYLFISKHFLLQNWK